MVPIIEFIGYIGNAILSLLIVAIFAAAILSWLVMFDIINLRNRFVYQLSRFLDAVTRPILRPLQRIIPPIGGIDITPLIALILLYGIRNFLWVGLINALLHLFGAGQS